jgi:hypothetical protein
VAEWEAREEVVVVREELLLLLKLVLISMPEVQDRAMMLGQVLIQLTVPLIKDGVRPGLEGELCLAQVKTLIARSFERKGKRAAKAKEEGSEQRIESAAGFGVLATVKKDWNFVRLGRGKAIPGEGNG